MVLQRDVLAKISAQINLIFDKIEAYEQRYEPEIKRVDSRYRESARNLIHYLALRSFNISTLEEEWSALGIPISTHMEGQILQNLIGLKVVVRELLDREPYNPEKDYITYDVAHDLLKRNTEAILGKSPKKRDTRIMVTQPTNAADDPEFIENLIDIGMDVARINCAHDDEIIWKAMIDNIRTTDSCCKIAMDLGGPKIRTGIMKPGPKVIHIKPKRNVYGQIVNPAWVWLAPYGIMPTDVSRADAVIPVNKKWLKKTIKGSYVIFRDARSKKCKLVIEEAEGIGRWATCHDSAFVTTDTLLNVFLETRTNSEIHTVHELLPLEEIIYLFEGDLLRLDKTSIPGEPAQRNDDGEITSIAHISCSEPLVFSYLKIDDPVYFDDGKIEGVVKAIQDDHALIEITTTKKKGGKLRAGKGINFPESNLDIKGLTERDKSDLRFVAEHADIVNFSFVNSKEDVTDLLIELSRYKADLGIILKIETMEAYKNLPALLLTAMENYPVGIMIARGDLAIETGWKKFAIIQEEILRICEAAHIPNIWATQVLESLAKKGLPTRSEITDAAVAQRSECVMLNKGYYILKAVKMLDKILTEMEHIRRKNKQISPKLKFNPIT
ncbi:MAG: hypothetical protein HKO90_11445 [Flavobacteriaceae bacterium]|nr:hypothetical protein [Flavobacteriaceae bacterium]